MQLRLNIPDQAPVRENPTLTLKIEDNLIKDNKYNNKMSLNSANLYAKFHKMLISNKCKNKHKALHTTLNSKVKTGNRAEPLHLTTQTASKQLMSSVTRNTYSAHRGKPTLGKRHLC